MKRVALYVRVSTELQVKEEGSLETQTHRLKHSLEGREADHLLVEVIREEGFSGKDLERPGMRRLLDLVRTRKIDLVMVTRIDRLSRSLADFMNVHQEFEANGVRFVSLNEQFDTTTAVGEAMLTIVLVFAQLERRQTAERTRAAVFARAQRGLFIGGRSPMGYARQTGGRLDLIPDEADLVRLVFDKYLALRSSRAVAGWLNENGYRQRSHASRKRRRGPKDDTFTPNAVLQMVTNPIYIGKIVYDGALTDKPLLFDGKHQAIINERIWSDAQNLIARNRVKLNGLATSKTHQFLLTGLLRCTCGYALTTSSGTGRNGTRHPYYRCTGMGKRSGHNCRVRQLRADALDEAVLRLIRSAVNEPAVLEDAARAANRVAADVAALERDRVVQLERDGATAQREAEAMLDQLLERDAADTETGKRRLVEKEDRVRQIQASLLEAQEQLASREGSQVDAERLMAGVRHFDTAWDGLSHAERKELLSLLLHEIRVGPEHITLDFYDGWIADEATQAIDAIERPPDPDVHRQGEGFADEMVWLPSPDVTAKRGRAAGSRKCRI